MTVNLFRHLLSLPVEFFERCHIGDISSRFGSLAPVGQLVIAGLVAMVLEGFMAIGTLAMSFIYSWQLMLAVLAFLVIDFIIEMIVFPIRKRKKRRDYQHSYMGSGFSAI